MSIKHLPLAARPREKLLAQGAASLADAELLALLLRTGVRGQVVLQLAEAVLARFGGFAGLLQADGRALGGMRGLGPAKCAELAAVIEMARRAGAQRLAERPVFDAPQAVKDHLSLQLAHLPHEVLVVLFLDSQHRLIAQEELFRGTLGRTSVYPREVVKRALARNAAAVVLAHKHPGVAEPSRADEHLTQALKSAGAGGRARARPPGGGHRAGGVDGRAGTGMSAACPGQARRP
jgi:DNA repair protein RadC